MRGGRRAINVCRGYNVNKFWLSQQKKTKKKKSKILRNTHIEIGCKELDFSLSSNVKLRRVTVSLVWGKIRNLIVGLLVGLLVGLVAPFLWVVINCAHQFLNRGDRATVLKN